MSFFRQLSLRTQMLTVVACIILAGFALTLSILTWQAGQMQREAALQYAGELAAHNGRAAAVPLQQGLEAARTLAAASVGSSPAAPTIKGRNGIPGTMAKSAISTATVPSAAG